MNKATVIALTLTAGLISSSAVFAQHHNTMKKAVDRAIVAHMIKADIDHRIAADKRCMLQIDLDRMAKQRIGAALLKDARTAHDRNELRDLFKSGKMRAFGSRDHHIKIVKIYGHNGKTLTFVVR